MKRPWHHCHVVVYLSADQPQQHLLIDFPSRDGFSEDRAQMYAADRVQIPLPLMYAAHWIYNFTTNEIIKNRTGKPVIPVLDALEVDRSWLEAHRLAHKPAAIVELSDDIRRLRGYVNSYKH